MKRPSDDFSSRIDEVKGTYIDGANNTGRVGAGPEGHVREAVLDVYGFKPIPRGGVPVTNEMVDRLRDDLGI